MKVKDNTVPEGKYVCEFNGTTEISTKDYGPRMQWEFIIVEGQHQGKKINGFSGVEPTVRNKCGRFLGMLAGVAISSDLEVDPDEYFGRRYLVEVSDSSTGRSSVVDEFKRLGGKASQSAQPIEIDPSETETTGQEIPF